MSLTDGFKIKDTIHIKRQSRSKYIIPSIDDSGGLMNQRKKTLSALGNLYKTLLLVILIALDCRHIISFALWNKMFSTRLEVRNAKSQNIKEALLNLMTKRAATLVSKSCRQIMNEWVFRGIRMSRWVKKPIHCLLSDTNSVTRWIYSRMFPDYW